MGDFKFEVWPTEHRVITQHFGANPRNYAQFGLPGHDGIDLRAPSGSKVFCVAPGEVIRVHHQPNGHNYGIHVRVLHQEGYKTVYAHLQEAHVKKGQIVEAGTVLGLADNTGNSFGSHLHLTLKKQDVTVGGWPYNIIDPTPYLLKLLGWGEPAGPFTEGWVLTASILIYGGLAQVNPGGATIYINPELNKIIPAGAMIIPKGSKDMFTQVKVPLATIGLASGMKHEPAPEPPAIVATVDGWASKNMLIFVDKQAIVGTHGVSLRDEQDQTAEIIGIVKAKSTITVLDMPQGQYVHVRVRRNDFLEPVQLPDPPPDPSIIPPEKGFIGWVLSQYLSPLKDQQALTSKLGVNLRSQPEKGGQNIGLVKGFATVRIAGPDQNEYTPILVKEEDVLNPVAKKPDITLPDPWPELPPAVKKPEPVPATIPGWSYTNGLYIVGSRAKVAKYGSNLRSAPNRDGDLIGFIPADSKIIVTGPAQGEYTPVRVDENILEPADGGNGRQNPDAPTMGQAQIGLHASADPDIQDEEHAEFAKLRPGIIKILSFHSADDVRKLANAHPKAQFVIRAFLSMKGRKISPGKFLADTVTDVQRALKELRHHDVVIELHNEPNLYAEGLGTSWSDGKDFNNWYLALLHRYRQTLPGYRFIYPGLSPGTKVTGVKLDHIQFIEASREAVEASDGLGIHLYWSQFHPMSRALETLDDYISRFRSHPIWVTEASRNHGPNDPSTMAREYLKFWHALQTRPVVKGVTYFVASASNPDFSHEVWMGKGIAEKLGRR